MEYDIARTKPTGEANKTERRRGSATNAEPELHYALQLQQQAGNQAMQQLLRSGAVRAKLTISQSDDPEEQEADQTADRIMRSHAGSGVAATSCSCGTDEEEMCDGCRQKAVGISRKAVDAGPPRGSHHVLDTIKRSSGHPLDAATRSFFEPRFGRDFSRVRIHSDAAAAASARSIQADAYAAGDHLVFDTGQFAPETEAGRRLLAHELTHVLQRGSADEIRRQNDGGAPDAAAPEPSVVDRVIAALQEPQENGVGNYTEAYSILNGLWIVDMFQQLEQLRARAHFDLLKENDPGQFQRVTVAIAAVAAKGTPAAAQFPARNPAFNSIEQPQQHEVATYLGLSWPLPQAASAGGESGLTGGEILTGVLVGAAVVGSVVFFVACPECVAVLAIVVSTGTADVAAGAAIDAGATVAVELVVNAAAVGGEGAAVTTVLGEGATATALTGTTTAAGTTAVTTTAATTTAVTTSTATTAAALTGTALATTALPSDNPQQDDNQQQCQGPTGLTPEDPIPITWFKVYSPSFYPTPIQVADHYYDRDDDSQHLPHGEPMGVSAEYRPYIGKVFQLLPIERGPGADRFRAVLQGYGFDWSGMQADHVQDLQWSGDDAFNNLWPLDASANMSAGPRQNDNQIVTFCNGPTGTPQTMTLRQMKAAGVAAQYFGRWFVITNITF